MWGDLPYRYFVASLVLAILATACVALRSWSRVSIKKSVGADDLFLYCAWIALLGLNLIASFVFNITKKEKSFPKLSQAEALTFFEASYIFETLYYVCMLSCKLSALCLYARVFRIRHFRVVVTVVAVVCVAWFMGSLIPIIVQCRPIAAAWDKSVPASCLDVNKMLTAVAIGNFLTDILVVTLPRRLVVELQLCARDKLLLAAVFGCGVTACICSLIRLIVQMRSNPSQDQIPLFLDSTFWTLAEAAVAVISVSLPACRPVVMMVRDSLEAIVLHGCRGIDNHHCGRFGRRACVGAGVTGSTGLRTSRRSSRGYASMVDVPGDIGSSRGGVRTGRRIASWYGVCQRKSRSRPIMIPSANSSSDGVDFAPHRLSDAPVPWDTSGTHIELRALGANGAADAHYRHDDVEDIGHAPHDSEAERLMAYPPPSATPLAMPSPGLSRSRISVRNPFEEPRRISRLPPSAPTISPMYPFWGPGVPEEDQDQHQDGRYEESEYDSHSRETGFT